VGVGPGDLDTAVRPFLQPGNVFIPLKVFHAHQVLLDVQAAAGIIGLAAFLAFYGCAVWRFIRLSAQGISLQWAWLLVFLLLWFPVNSHHGFYSSEMVLLTFFVLGLGLATPRAASAGAP
jgi:O-antigen ligase